MQEIPCKDYVIQVGHGLLASVPAQLLELLPKVTSFIVISDSNVAPLYAQTLLQRFQRRVELYVVPAGEASKNRRMKDAIEDFMLEKRMHRDCCVVALGGGVVGDLAGFVASTYMRGVPFVQIPTSLLACVDSSIGGKTGIDVAAGKNLIGAFHQPKRVFADLDVLSTLPKRELINGMAEIIKAGAIYSESLFSKLESNVDAILALKKDVVLDMVATSVSIKATIVEQDEKEHVRRPSTPHKLLHSLRLQGLRAILNFGHSVGHGIEAIMQPELLHGECVAIGMVKEAEIARGTSLQCPCKYTHGAPLGLGLCSSATVGRLVRCIKAFGLPVRVPARALTATVLEKMEVDKKNSGGIKKLILLTSIGTVHSNPFTVAVEDARIAHVLEPQVLVVPPSDPISGTVQVPGSKSISNRVLLMAALGSGYPPLYDLSSHAISRRPVCSTCRISGLLHSDDTQVMMDVLQYLGAHVSWENDGDVLVVVGTAGKFPPSLPGHWYLSNAGTATRFLTTVATLAGTPVHITGNSRMQERPISDLVDALVANGSQYVSSVLLSAPYANAPLDLRLAEDHPTSFPYIQMTTQLMSVFGIQVQTLGPPHGSLNAIEIDMETMTDAFMTLAVLAAVATGVTKITGIANQRVKESRRPRSPDVSQYENACPWHHLTIVHDVEIPAKIACHNDHRIAMSFAVLGSYWPNIVIADKECTDKTFPSFWDECHAALKIPFEVPSASLATTGAVDKSTVYLIGMRGVGKTSLGMSVKEYVAANGWAAFRAQEVVCLQSWVQTPPINTIVSCGGGVVESPEAVALLSQSSNVIYLQRTLTDIEATLAQDESRPAYGEDIATVFHRRVPLFTASSSFVFPVLPGDVNYTRINRDFVRLLMVVLGRYNLAPLKTQPDTYFVSLTFPNYTTVPPDLVATVADKAHALELRVDLLESFDKDFIANQVAALRAASTLPIIYTVRTIGQGGAFPDDPTRVFDLLHFGMSIVESRWKALFNSFVDHSKVGGMAMMPLFVELFELCAWQGNVDMAKVVIQAYDVSDAYMIHQVVESCRSRWGFPMPCIALCTTEAGKLSRVLNRTLTPVTHPALPVAAAPVALVVGAGGTAMAACYAMQQLGLQVLVYNRTLEKAKEVAARFGATAVASLADIAAVDVVVGTIPATSGFTLPDRLVRQGVIVMDAAYKPAITPLLAHAHAHAAVCIQGYEMLVEQGLEQSKLWTGETVQKSILADQVKATLAATDFLH
ncbi:hypothetical protein DYB32_005655 [Aphanomyces invadans]|uniref:Uncharacterized protein n=1 Tax=Aphanomyces invadans TaxID=157072 RepID=A0A418AWL1_9STRA|nr:hypothetical protein DYB32_005655 [Aphanomyces invadans]